MKILNLSSLNRNNNSPVINPKSLITNAGLGANVYTITTSGTISNLPTFERTSIKLTQATQINGIADAEDGKIVIIHNGNSVPILIKNNSNNTTFGNQILTGTGIDSTLNPNSSILLQYDGENTVWRVIGNSSGSEFYPTSVKTANYSAFVFDLVLCDTTNGGFTITLPSSPINNDAVAILDVAGTFFNNKVIISSTSKIQGVNDTWSIDLDYTYVELIYSSYASSWFFKDVPDTIDSATQGLIKTSHNQSFTNSDLNLQGILPVTHSLGVQYPIVQVYDNNSYQILPTEIISTGIDTVNVDLSGYMPITGTWRVRII